MNRQSDGMKPIKIWVEEFDEEDWRQLFRNDLLGEYEDGKSFLRVN
jgi:hypothetical protein